MENSRLMQWCHRQIAAKLKMLCKAYGLVVIETPAAYSSRFCSRTGQAGFRAQELNKAAFESDFYWRKAVEKARKEPGVNGSSELIALADAFATLPDGSKKTYLVPRTGGGAFVPSGSGATQSADLNAAVNLALRATAAPNVLDIHVRVRSEWKGSGYVTRETRNRFGSKPVEIEMATAKEGSDGEAPEALDTRPKFFFVVGADGKEFSPGFDRAEVQHEGALTYRCHSGRALWITVNDGAWRRVAKINGFPTEEDEIPL